MRENLKIGHIKVQSIFTGFNDLREIIGSSGFDALALSETWLSHEHSNNTFNIPNYLIIRKDGIGRGGGVAIYVSTKYKPERIDITCDESPIEQLWIKIWFGIKTGAIVVFYRRPKTNINNALEWLDEVWSYILPVNLFIPINAVTECFDCYGFCQVIDDATRITATTSTLSDPIYISESGIVVGSGVIEADAVSDHRLIFCELSLKVEKFKPKIVKYRDFKNFNTTNFYRNFHGWI